LTLLPRVRTRYTTLPLSGPSPRTTTPPPDSSVVPRVRIHATVPVQPVRVCIIHVRVPIFTPTYARLFRSPFFSRAVRDNVSRADVVARTRSHAPGKHDRSPNSSRRLRVIVVVINVASHSKFVLVSGNRFANKINVKK